MKKKNINSTLRHHSTGINDDFTSFFSFLLHGISPLLPSEDMEAKVEKQYNEKLLKVIDALLAGVSWLMLQDRVELPIGSVELARKFGFNIQKESSVYHTIIPPKINLFLERYGKRLRIHYYGEFLSLQGLNGTIEFEFDKFVKELLSVVEKLLAGYLSSENKVFMLPPHLNYAFIVLKFYKWVLQKWNNETPKDIYDEILITTHHLRFEIYLNEFNLDEAFNPFPMTILFNNHILLGTCQGTAGKKRIRGIMMGSLYVFNELLYAISWIMEPDSLEGGLYAGELREYAKKLGFSVGYKNPLYLISFGCCCSIVIFEREDDSLLIHYYNSLINCGDSPYGTIKVNLREFIEEVLRSVFIYLTDYMEVVEKIRADYGQKPEEYMCNELWSNYKHTLMRFKKIFKI